MKLLSRFLTFKIVISFLLISEVSNDESSNSSKSFAIHKGIHKRALFYPFVLFPYNAAIGILVALAIPLDIPGRSIFVSYNFESNFFVPNQPNESFPGPIIRFPGLIPTTVVPNPEENIILRRSFKNEVTGSSKTESFNDDSSLFVRKAVYRLIESRLNSRGIDGKKCLLRAICESATYPLIENNGVVGHILHIVLTPSSSLDEELPKEYSKAEILGRENNCVKYERHCKFSLLNTFTKLI
ncbi:CLUMA_CG005218, isoform A [Clunio marinus]|uniref:CLUMA_CG005218, isoform A n=1 Tax=Clunio marinus TaxID=568069 RepID=A0A1J1HU84_9DIPT|nr:CLUMA_CG005218, isoform A [Clunio marinus]